MALKSRASLLSSTFKFALGDTVKDEITGFKGKVYSRTEWYNGCKRYCLWGTKLSNKDEIVELYFDEEQLVLVTPVKNSRVKEKPTGGPFSAPARTGAR